ncbi:MAG: C25 family cysteine peptidase [Candidatus Electryonea clarkiae]|nr:C25 family cysteine peptidase [Candidatus Electryonea clarkiae]MDP8288436.1 C25 family cysteine peptidase [Candidatus Electryonea clarkiae]
MSITIRRISAAVLSVFLAMVSVNSIAGQNSATDNFQPLRVAQFEKEPGGFFITLTIDQPSWQEVDGTIRTLWTPEIANGGLLREYGEPQVPTAGRLFRLPAKGKPIVEIVEVEYETIEGINVAAFLGTEDDLDSPNLNDLGPVENPLDKWYPGNWVSVGDPAIMHDFRVASITTFPVQVNPARQEARIASNLQVRIRFENGDDHNTLLAQPTSISQAFLPFYRQLLDWNDSELDEYTLYRGGVQVIMRDDEDLIELMQPWFEWKLQKGWDLELLTDSDVDWNNSDIRDELQDRWDESEIKFDYVVVIGDDQGVFSVPAGSGSGYGAGDHPYSCVAGNDNLVDVGIGRISVQNLNQLRTYINKVLSYERDPDLDNTDWYLRGMLNKSDNHNGNSKVQTLRYVRRCLYDIGYTQVDTTWARGNQGNQFATQKIEDGVSLYCHRGYINAGLSSTQIMNLDNEFMTPVVLDITTATGNWSNSHAISEAYMLAGTPNSPRGGIGAFGQATSSSRPDLNNSSLAGAAWAMLQLRTPCLGDMTTGAKINLWNNFSGNNETILNSGNNWINLMGDPLVWVWTSVPQVFDVTAEEGFVLGNNSYNVIVEDEETGDPVEEAWVTLYKVDDNEEIIVKGVTDSNGEIILDVPIRYAGEAMLTVTKQHYAPSRIEVEIISPNSRIGYVNVEYIDDGNNGTEGNDNGIPEAGETVGIRIQMKNFGDDTETEIEFTGSSEEEWITDIEGAVTINTLLQGQAGWGNGLILIEIEPEAQHDWIMHIDLEATTADGGEYDDVLAMTVAAPQYQVVSITFDEDIEPGDFSDLELAVTNTGGSDADVSNGVLISNDFFVFVSEAEDDFDEMAVGDTTSGLFEIQMHPLAIPGYPADMSLIVTSESGQTDTVSLLLYLGEKESSDPVGPDGYGYYAFDETDTAWSDVIPEFDWIEINPEDDDFDFEGTELDINDGAENFDESVVIELPFSIQYYGVVFDTATICSNGWIAMGNQGDMQLARNWTIPSPLGPNNMIAVNWDDMRLTGDAGIFTYYDRPNGRFIVEWYDVLAGGVNRYPNRFEVIFFEHFVRPTYSGDNDFLFQYDDHNFTTNTMQYDVPYWTTGIENGNQTDGLLIAFYNDYSPGAAQINDESSILFSTNVYFIHGFIQGRVTDLSTGDPLPGVSIYTDNLYHFAESDNDGYYSMENIAIGEYEMHFELDCYNSSLSDSVIVTDDDTTIVNVSLRHPELTLSTYELEHELSFDNEETVELTVNNAGNGLLEYAGNVYIVDTRERPDPTTEPWNSLYAFDLSPDESRYHGLAFVGRNYFISGSDNFDPTGPNKIYKYDDQGRELLTTYNQPVPLGQRSATGMRGLAWDGEYLYGVDDEVIYQMEVQPDTIILTDSWDVPLETAHFLEWDSANELFWMGDYNSDIYGIDRNGETIERFEREFIPRGAALNPNDESGRNLYLFSQLTSRSDIQVVRMNPVSGESNLLHTIPYIAGRWALSGVDFSSTWNPLVHVFSAVINQTEESYVQVWYFNDNETFFSIHNPDGTVNGGEDNIVEFMFRSTGLPAGSYSFFVGFENNACEDETNFISITMTLPDTTDDITDPEIMQPLEWSFDGAYPNPFNQTLTVRFALKETAIVRMKIYNLLGQEVAELADLPMAAGRHALPFAGSDLSSGMYFLQFEAGPLNETRKIVLLK